MSDDLVIGLQVTVIGFSIVLASLIILYLLMHVLGRFLGPGVEKEEDEKRGKDEKSGENNALESKSPVAETGNNQEEILDDSSEVERATLAAISGAVAVVLGVDRGFRIKSVKPIKRNRELSHWIISGKEEQN